MEKVISNPDIIETILSVTLRVTSKDSGSYRCVAANVFNHTVFTANSSEVEITVKG